MKIKGRTFIVTGGSSGLGQAVVNHFVSQEANVAIFDFNEDGLSMQKEKPDRVLFCKVDVSNEASVSKALESVVSKFQAVHGVIQCAGTAWPNKVLSAKGEPHSLKIFEKVVQVNLIGTFNVLRLAAAIMSKQESVDGEKGVFVHVASVAAFEGQIGQAAYSASKSGVVGMTLPIARELAQHGIRVVTVAPGLFETPMLAKLPEKAKASLIKQVPFPKRLGQPEEFARVCAHIVENAYINGTTLRIDGSIRMGAM